jgi:cell division protein FtsQ
LQQVGRLSSAPAFALNDSATLPLPNRAGARSRVNLGHLWLLRRRLLIQAGALLAVAGIATLAFQSRDLVLNTLAAVSAEAAQGFSQAGLVIDQISISGQALTDERSIIAALGVSENLPMVSFDAESARARLEDLPAVISASVAKIYPSSLSVTIVEKEPVARWRVDGVTFVIDADGEQLAAVDAAFDDLPLLVGDGAADDAVAIIEILRAHPLLDRRLVAISRIADRRWDLVYDNGLRIMLPETGIESAVSLLEQLDREHEMLARDLSIIDLRVSGQLALRPIDRTPATGTPS